jgi:molybdopterin/thiamine biosynthesis adenylyltransferase
MVATSPSVDRQGYLGPGLKRAMRSARIGIIGLSGGGSHLVQGLAHYGFERYLLVDPKTVSEVHRHRLVGIKDADVLTGAFKTEVACRVIRGVRPRSDIELRSCPWQDCAEELRTCDVLFGAVDGLRCRSDLEALARRYMIPYIDIGMNVRLPPREPPRVYGQVAISAPGLPCFMCLGLLSDDGLRLEDATYGTAGVEQQVVSVNGILAHAAVDLAVEYITAWAGDRALPVLRRYDGNAGTLVLAEQLKYHMPICPHFPTAQRGDPTAVRW